MQGRGGGRLYRIEQGLIECGVPLDLPTPMPTRKIMSTKGSWQRPVNKKVFDENYERIFKKEKEHGDGNNKLRPNKSTSSESDR